jgi:phage baseplate assembly protein gpV
MELKTGVVTQVYPGGICCDLVMDDGKPLARVPIMSGSMASDGGAWSMPSVSLPASQAQAGALNTDSRNVVAVVLMRGSSGIVIGFTRPVNSVMSFTEQDRAIYRHPASGGYVTFAPDGSFEAHHASGAYVRIGTGPHQDLAAVTSGNWDGPAAPPPTITIGHPAFSLTVDPAGNVTATYTSLTMNGPVQLNGSLTATGDGIFEGVSVPRHDHTYNAGTAGQEVTSPPVPGS